MRVLPPIKVSLACANIAVAGCSGVFGAGSKRPRARSVQEACTELFFRLLHLMFIGGVHGNRN